MEADIQCHLEEAQKQRPLLEKQWDELYKRVADEQEVYQAQVNDILRMRGESQHLSVITRQLSPFVKSICSVTQRMLPRLSESEKNMQDTAKVQEMLEQITKLDPDSQHRVEAIRSIEADRLQQFANRTNPLDKELVRTKGQLRAPPSDQRRDDYVDFNHMDCNDAEDSSVSTTAELSNTNKLNQGDETDKHQSEVNNTTNKLNPGGEIADKLQSDVANTNTDGTSVEEVSRSSGVKQKKRCICEREARRMMSDGDPDGPPDAHRLREMIHDAIISRAEHTRKDQQDTDNNVDIS